MAGSRATPASFAELWEQLGMAHNHEVSELREENFRMRCRLAYTAHEYPCCGTFEDKDGGTITVAAVGDSIVVAFPAHAARLREGDVSVLGIPGKYKDGLMLWGNGDRWRKTSGGRLKPLSTEEEDDEEEEGTPKPGPKRRQEPPNGDADADGEEPAGRQEPDGPDAGTASRGISKENARRELRRQGTAGSLKEAVRNFAGSNKKEKLPFAKENLALQRGGTFQCGAYLFLEWMVRSPWFEAAVWVLIVFSTVTMAAELQYEGNKLGFELGYPGYVTAAAVEYPGAANVFNITELVFGISFTLYLILKLAIYRGEFWCGQKRLWNIADLLIAFLWWMWHIDHIGNSSGVFRLRINPQVLRVFRLSRIIRQLELLRHFMTFDSLHVMTTALKGSFNVFVWAMFLLCLFQTVLALILTGTLQEFYLDADANDIVKRREVYEYFGTFTRTFLTMFELSLANWPVASRILTENISEWWTVFAILHKVTIGFALVGIINGVFMQETFKVAAMDDKIMLRQKQAAGRVHETKMRALFTHLDTSHDDKLDRQEFQIIANDRHIKDWLAAQDITVNDADSLFKLIAGQGNLEITLDELIAGLGQMKGTVRTLDFMLLKQQVLESNDILRKIAGLPRQ